MTGHALLPEKRARDGRSEVPSLEKSVQILEAEYKPLARQFADAKGEFSRLERSARSAVLARCHVVAATLSSSAGSDNTDALSLALSLPSGSYGEATASSAAAALRWDAVIVDEACQGTDSSTLVALTATTGHALLAHGVQATVSPTVVLVGDPQQLPATVLSQRAARSGFGRSMFERLYPGPGEASMTISDAVSKGLADLPAGTAASKSDPGWMSWRPTAIGGYFLLDTQYRMHPGIRLFPSRTFYDGRIRDGVPVASETLALMEDRRKSRPQPYHACDVFQPVMFFNVLPDREGMPSNVYENPAEARLVARLVAEILRVAMLAPDPSTGHTPAKLDLRGRIGVITPYRNQTSAVRSALQQELGVTKASWVDVSTVDGFQGQEKDVIVLTCVRTDGSRGDRDLGRAATSGIGFVRDPRRMNVALTRARHCLLVVGDDEWLSSHDSNWSSLLQDLKRRNRYLDLSASGVPSLPATEDPSWSSKAVWNSIRERMRGFVLAEP